MGVEKYFPPPLDTETYVDDTEWHPLIDGAAYFAALDDLLRQATAGDAVYVAGFEINPKIDLAGRDDSDPDHLPLSRQLCELAARGVDVRIIMASRVFASSLPRSVLPFRGNAETAELLRTMTVPGSDEPPLRGRVALDFSGALLGSNHQKAITMRVGGELTSFVGGVDLAADRFDAAPHDTLRYEDERWGWHDIVVRLRGTGARSVWQTFRQRWAEVLTLPDEHWLRGPLDRLSLNRPGDLLPPPDDAPDVAPVSSPGTSVRVLRSTFRLKIDSRLPFRRRHWDALPDTGLTEVFTTLVTAINAAERYVYLEDQYLEESVGGDERYELFPYLRAAALRGVKIMLVGSGIRDPEDIDFGGMYINRKLNDDLRKKLAQALPREVRHNLAVHRIEHCTVHAKLTMIDDVFANIGSANMFSRSMVGVDSEISAAVVTTGSAVRDLRVAVWGEHLRAPMTDLLRKSLEDLDLALGIWRPEWLPAYAARGTWRTENVPEGFEPAERVIAFVGPS